MKKLFTLAAVPALLLSLTACGGKKEAPKPAGSDAPAASAPTADAPKPINEDVKKIVANEYKDFDEKNQCWVVKSGADSYCLAPNTTSKYTLFKDGNKTKIDYVILQSKGKLVKGELNEKADGGIAVVAVDKDGQVVAKLPFTKEWRSSQNEHDSHQVMNTPLGQGIAGISVRETVTIEWPVEKPGEHHDDWRRAAYDVTKLYAFDGSSVKQVAKVRTRFTDSKIPYHVSAPMMSNGPVDPDTGYKGLTFKVNAAHKAEAFNNKTYEAKYNAAKKQYEVPAELRKVMKE